MSDMEIYRHLGATLFVGGPVPALSMTARTTFVKTFLRALSWVSFAIAGLAFWVGGRAISEFGHMDRILAEALGLSIAGATGVLGYVLKSSADDLGEDEDSSGQ